MLDPPAGHTRNLDLPSRGRAFRTGFLTNGLNPKGTLFFLSLFTVIIDPKTPVPVQAIYGFYMAVATFIWFSMLSLFFGNNRIRIAFYMIGHWFDRMTGAALLFLGIKLALSAQDSPFPVL